MIPKFKHILRLEEIVVVTKPKTEADAAASAELDSIFSKYANALLDPYTIKGIHETYDGFHHKLTVPEKLRYTINGDIRMEMLYKRAVQTGYRGSLYEFWCRDMRERKNYEDHTVTYTWVSNEYIDTYEKKP